MKKTLISLVLSGFSLCQGAEFLLANKQKIICDKIIMAKESPTVFISAKSESGTKTYRFSEVDFSSLSEELRLEFEKYKADQLQKRIILKDEKWISRDGMLLKEDKKYGYKKPLGKVGDSIIEFVNQTDSTVTLGMRSGDRGYEMFIEAGKKKSYQVPNGIIHYVMAQESKDGKSLIVQLSKDQEMKNVRFTVTIVPSDEIPVGELGSIDIPAEYQVSGK